MAINLNFKSTMESVATTITTPNTIIITESNIHVIDEAGLKSTFSFDKLNFVNELPATPSSELLYVNTENNSINVFDNMFWKEYNGAYSLAVLNDPIDVLNGLVLDYVPGKVYQKGWQMMYQGEMFIAKVTPTSSSFVREEWENAAATDSFDWTNFNI
jgi:hypothetical protein